jgi:quinol-cytochrome oxidoreductase complex cytochrome b subunit
LGAAFFVLLPFLDRRAGQENRDWRFTAAFCALLIYVAIFQLWAWLAPGAHRAADHAPEQLAAETYDRHGGSISLLLFWSVIIFLVFYLRRLLQENARTRKLYHPSSLRMVQAIAVSPAQRNCKRS